MADKLSIYISDSYDPYHNLALEKYLTLHTAPGECILFLWRNDMTVVVGRNQNCWSECRLSLLEAEGGHLARRLSGGGAVYHDKENLNFTFATRHDGYDLQKQLSVIAAAVGKFGISTEFSGRNDLLARGCKFSGNAFWHSGECHFHHGTILIRTDTDRMMRYLSVPGDKLKSKGVTSIRSRVVNLSELNPRITVEGMIERLVEAFGEVYRLAVEEYCFSPKAADKIAEYRAEFDSPDWKYGRTPGFTHSFSGRFAWGGITFCLDVKEGKISDCGVFSDSLDPDFISGLPRLLIGQNYNAADMREALSDAGSRCEIEDIGILFFEEI